MQSAAIRPAKAQLWSAMVGLALLCALMLLLPFACPALALVTPLLGCPLVGNRRQWAAWIAGALPAAVSLLSGFDPLYSLSLLLPGLLPLFLTLWLRARRKLAAPSVIPLFIVAYATALTLVVAAASHALGAGLAEGLTEQIVARVASSDQPGLVLYRFALAGLLSVPDSYHSGVLPLFLLDIDLVRQMLLSLRLHVQALLAQTLPPLFVQACVLGGLFTALRVQHLNCAVLIVGPDPEHPGGRKARVASPPGFRLLMLPAHLRWPLCLMAVVSLVLLTSDGDLAQTLGQLFFAAFTCAFQLAGAAVLVCMLASRAPDRAPLYGVLAAVLYVLFPMVLFLLGVTDQALHFRTRLLKRTDSHKEG